MTYTDLLRTLYYGNYDRVERDDRLLDVFPTQIREKGVELWEQWSEHEVRILRVRAPFNAKKLELFVLARAQLESMLRRNVVSRLDDFEKVAAGFAEKM
jgi:hypothetical protein